MNNLFLKKHIKKAILNLLKEETVPPADEKKAPDNKAKDSEKAEKQKKKKKVSSGEIKIASGAVGRGSFKKFVREAGARSTSDPKGLMRDLGVEKSPEGDDLQKLQQILSASTNTHPAMKRTLNDDQRKVFHLQGMLK